MKQPDIEVGQIWERISDGKRVEIVDLGVVWPGVVYVPVSGPRRLTDILTSNFRRRYRLTPPTSTMPPRVEAGDAVSAETRSARDLARPAAVGGGPDE